MDRRCYPYLLVTAVKELQGSFSRISGTDDPLILDLRGTICRNAPIDDNPVTAGRVASQSQLNAGNFSVSRLPRSPLASGPRLSALGWPVALCTGHTANAERRDEHGDDDQQQLVLQQYCRQL